MSTVPPAPPVAQPAPPPPATTPVKVKWYKQAWIYVLIAAVVVVVVVGSLVATLGSVGSSVATTKYGNNWMALGIPHGWTVGSKKEAAANIGSGDFSFLASSSGDPGTALTAATGKALWMVAIVEPSDITGPAALSAFPEQVASAPLQYGFPSYVYSSSLPKGTKVTVGTSTLTKYTDTFEVQIPAVAQLGVPATNESFGEVVFTNGKTVWIVVIGGATAVFNKDKAQVAAIENSVQAYLP